MSVRTISYVSTINANSDTSLALAMRFMVEDIQRKSEPFTPKLSGDLRKRVIKQVMGRTATIIWDTEYAAYQEDIQHRNYTTAGTGPHFAENAVSEVVGNADYYFEKANAI